MRNLILLLAAVAAPAVAADPTPAPASPPAPVQPDSKEVADAQRAIADPATGAAIARVMPALAKAMMDMPVGEMEAAIEGRKPTKADRKRTVRDTLGSPEEVARTERELASSGAQMQVMQKALAAALPGMIAAAGVMQQEMEKATANLPQPAQPSR